MAGRNSSGRFSGAVLLVALGLLPAPEALAGVMKGADVYLFLIGMMLLSELARQEGLFDWVAARAARTAKGSATRLFTLVFAVGTVWSRSCCPTTPPPWC